jgi:EPS-associated MarR family transcriptional regulator
MTIDAHYKLLRLLEENPAISQRELARRLGISLGKTNYCVQALIKKGWLKVSHFTNSQNKSAYKYLLTRRGLERKASLTLQYLQLKMQEYENLRAEIEEIGREARRISRSEPDAT